MVVVKQNHPIMSNEWHFFTLGGWKEDNTVLVMVERQGRSRWGWLGDVQSLRLGESASQHAAVTTATVTCGPTAGARPTTVRPN